MRSRRQAAPAGRAREHSSQTTAAFTSTRQVTGGREQILDTLAAARQSVTSHISN
jgi:hypothetical protein